MLEGKKIFSCVVELILEESLVADETIYLVVQVFYGLLLLLLIHSVLTRDCCQFISGLLKFLLTFGQLILKALYFVGVILFTATFPLGHSPNLLVGLIFLLCQSLYSGLIVLNCLIELPYP